MRALQIIGMFLLLVASPASAGQAPAWVVTQKSGDVRVLRNGMQPASLEIRSSVSAGDTVATGANGRALLTNGDDYVIVAPGSRLLVPREQQQSGFTKLVQQVGTMLYKVKHTGIPHFSVQTPMLAAVVKGTSFTIVVDDKRAAVQVTDGIVEVSSADGFSRRLVERGLTVYVGRERPSEIIELKSGAQLPPASGDEAVKVERSGDVPLSTVASLTGGLVRETPAAPVPVAVASPAVAIAASQPVEQPATAPVVVSAADVSAPAVAAPVADVVQQVIPAVSADVSNVLAPVTSIVAVDTVSVTTPAVTTPAITTPAITTPIATITPVVVSNTTLPSVTVTPTVISAPTVSTPAITTPTVTLPEVTVASVTIPVVTVPTVTVAPTVTTPTVITPPITTPTVTTPVVTIPTVTVPAITVPSLGLGMNGG